MTIKTTSVSQGANKELGTEEKILYYLIVQNNINKKLVVNVGKKTHDSVQALIENESVDTPETQQQLLKQQKGGK